MKVLFTIFTLLVSSLSFATSELTSSTIKPASGALANINSGNMQIGGGFTWVQNTGSDSASSSYYSLYPYAEYFVIDGFSIGGTLSYYDSINLSSYSGYGIGPSFSYYFFQKGQIAAYAAQAVTFNKYSGSTSTNARGMTSIGVKYFAVPQVAFGVSLATSYNLDGDSGYNYNTTALSGDFSFYY